MLLQRRYARGLLVVALMSSGGITWSAVNAHANERPAASTVDVAKMRSFETAFTRQVNDIIRNPAMRQAKETTFINTKVYRDVVDRTIYKTTDAKALRGLTTNELQAVRALVLERNDEAIALGSAGSKKYNDLLTAKVERDFVTTRILPPEQKNSALLNLQSTVNQQHH